MKKFISNLEALEGACGLCLQGLHWRCGGRRGCRCTNCRRLIKRAVGGRSERLKEADDE